MITLIALHTAESTCRAQRAEAVALGVAGIPALGTVHRHLFQPAKCDFQVVAVAARGLANRKQD